MQDEGLFGDPGGRGDLFDQPAAKPEAVKDAKKESASAGKVRENARQPEEAGEAGGGGEADRGGDLQQEPEAEPEAGDAQGEVAPQTGDIVREQREAPVASLTGQELGEHARIGEMRKAAQQWYDANLREVASGVAGTNCERVDQLVNAGDQLFLRVRGTSESLTTAEP